MSCGVGPRCSLDLVLLWPWCRPTGVAPIQPLAWETSYATGAALKKKKKKRWSQAGHLLQRTNAALLLEIFLKRKEKEESISLC